MPVRGVHRGKHNLSRQQLSLAGDACASKMAAVQKKAEICDNVTRGEMINEYRKLNSEDRKAFRRWLWANTIVGVILLAGLIALVSKFPGV